MTKFIRKRDIEYKKVDDNTVVEYYGFKTNDYDLIGINLDGYHGEFTNSISTKTYYITEGKIEFNIEGEIYLTEVGDIISIEPNKKHSLNGEKAKAIIICNPVFNPNDEVKI